METVVQEGAVQEPTVTNFTQKCVHSHYQLVNASPLTANCDTSSVLEESLQGKQNVIEIKRVKKGSLAPTTMQMLIF